MSDFPILFSTINDFIFCPASIYFHGLFDDMKKEAYQSKYQIDGTYAHKTIDNGTYSSRKNILMGEMIYCEKYDILGKIDIFDVNKGILTERKKKVSAIYDGQIFQIYAQYFALVELGYIVKKLRIHSLDDNKNHNIDAPTVNAAMLKKFEETLDNMRQFDVESFTQVNPKKCSNCIYEPLCGSSCWTEGEKE